MTKDDAAQDKLQWHPAFLQAIQMELQDYRDFLEFRYEYHLTSEPLRIDLLIIKKPKDLSIDKNIARIFRTDNVVEYKSPEDNLSVKDFWKVCAYANLYAAITPGVNLSDLTLTFVESRHPRKLLEYLVNTRGYTVRETSPGIYRVTGDYLPIQIIESKKLPEDENFWLNSLTNDLEKSSLNVIVNEGKKQGPEMPIDAYIDVIIRANKKAYKEVDKMWQDTLFEILEENGTITRCLEEKGTITRLKEEWKVQGIEQGREQGREQGIEQGREQGIEQGREQGKEKAARNLLARSMPIEDIAQVTELPIEKIRSLAAVN